MGPVGAMAESTEVWGAAGDDDSRESSWPLDGFTVEDLLDMEVLPGDFEDVAPGDAPHAAPVQPCCGWLCLGCATALLAVQGGGRSAALTEDLEDRSVFDLEASPIAKRSGGAFGLPLLLEQLRHSASVADYKAKAGSTQAAAVRAVLEFCQRRSTASAGSESLPGPTELSELWRRCSPAGASALANALRSQLLPAAGGAPGGFWAPRLRALYALEFFCWQGSLGLEVFNLVVVRTQPQLERLANEVPQCHSKAQRILSIVRLGCQAEHLSL